MSAKDPAGLSRPKGSLDTRWITATVAMFAIAVFTVSASQIMPALVGADDSLAAPSKGLVTAFLVNIALILFAWRRSEQLKATSRNLQFAERTVHNLAYFDELAGLHNRRHLGETVAEFIASGSRQAAMILIDLDHFKQVNDLYGHHIGDLYLQIIAARIRGNAPEGADCVRLGGDEFAVFFRGASASERTLEDYADHLLEALEGPIQVAEQVLTSTASLGISIFDDNCKDLGALLRRADIAMYEAKRLGRNRYVFFNSAMEQDLAYRTRLEMEIRKGIQDAEFEPYFQPIFDLASKRAIGFEVLARWNHPTRGILEPHYFLKVAENSALITELSMLVMRSAMETVARCGGVFKVCFNISPIQFKDPLFAQRIMLVLKETGFSASRLELEIREKCLFGEPGLTLQTIKRLREAGVTIAIDDFGASYGAITRLEELPFDRIKIDREFISSLDDEKRSEALIKSISILGKGLKIPMTAEGVETDPVLQRLANIGCDDAQGWLFGQAIPASALQTWSDTHELGGEPETGEALSA